MYKNLRLNIPIKIIADGENMFETPTQRNFRKQIREIQQQNKSNNDIYGSSPRTVSFDENTSGKRSTLKNIILFLVIVISISSFTIKFKNPTTNLTSSSSLNTELSNSDAAFLQKLNECSTDLNTISQKVSQFHSNNLSRSRQEEYKDSLLTGITKCDQWEKDIKSQKFSKIVNPLYLNTQEYISNLRQAFKYYLDSTYSLKSSHIEIANKYFNTISQNRAKHMQLLITIFDENNFKYEKHSVGSIRYWYEKEN